MSKLLVGFLYFSSSILLSNLLFFNEDVDTPVCVSTDSSAIKV